MKRSERAVEHLPLKAADLQILLVLLSGELHPYGLMKRVRSESGGRVRLELGSLYRLIDRLLRVGLIERAEGQDTQARRRRYAITELGREVVAAEIDRLEELVERVREQRLEPAVSSETRGRS